MLPWKQNFLQDFRTPLIFLCMFPLCSTKETLSVTKQHRQHLDYEDFVELQNLPIAVANADISVKYLCTKPCIVHVDVMASSEFRTGILVFKKRFKNIKCLREKRAHKVHLKLPDMLVYRNDYFMKHPIGVYFVVVRAWVVHIDNIDPYTKHNETIVHAVANTFSTLDIVPPFQRPYKDNQVCFMWGFEYIWRQREQSIFVCQAETDFVNILNFPLASSREHYGIIKTFKRFRNRDLEMRRQLYINNPKFTISIWMYLLHYCSNKQCGIIYHIDNSKMYTTPLLFLNDRGQIHIQMQLVTGVSFAVLTTIKVPLLKWFRLDISFYGRKIMLTISGEDLNLYGKHAFNVNEDIHYDDIVGYMTLGGSKYVHGIDGFFGPVIYYRLSFLETDEINSFISSSLVGNQIYKQLDLYYQRYSAVQDIVQQHATILGDILHTPNNTKNYYMYLYRKYGQRPTCHVLPWEKSEKNDFSNLFKLLHTVQWQSLDFSNNLVYDFGKKIFENITTHLPNGLHGLSAAVPSLEDSSFSGYHKASHLLAVMYEVGLGVNTDPVQGFLYSLVGAQANERLALLKLGYKHFQGIDNYPLDLDLSYAYYISIAKKTPNDRWAKHAEQAIVETIRLMDHDKLKEQTRENGDIFLWLKQNAERGDASSQHKLAQMLFWGQQGVSKNTKAALEWYERGALDSEDPILMYDYAVLLLKGQGITKDKKLALKLMKKAAAKGQNEALNGLGWYYHNFRNNYVKAAKYWKKAYRMGNVDSAFNLGIMYLHGKYPGEQQINETRAVEYISRASYGGHIEGTIQFAQYLITGSLKSLPRNPKMAVIYAKNVAEKNVYLGHDVRKALNSYMDGSVDKAFLHYMLTAEAGMEMSQTNMAYLCEESSEPNTLWLRDACIWRYYNLSVNQHYSPPFALLKMGDLYYYGSNNHTRDLESSMQMYTQAALQGDSQGFFNLAQLVHEGISIPEYLLQKLNIDRSFFISNDTLIVELYERCQNHSEDKLISPCSLALLYRHLSVAWKYILQSFLFYVLGTLLFSILIVATTEYFRNTR
ncbi:protein sel-1 homolog 3 [Bombina bombina]|uniref:protein sel-1 homolog 3 n=1 Tax=Bombina bombina TaxID=8345 RepID=UPI00235A77D3|nr:protein sel-1 homolog 3 [Bombina bombina]